MACRDTLGHFIHNTDLTRYFPSISDMLSKNQVEQPERLLHQVKYSGSITKLIDRSYNPFGFIACGDLGDIYFNQRSLINPEEWSLVQVGSKIIFDVIFMEKPYKSLAISACLEPNVTD